MGGLLEARWATLQRPVCQRFGVALTPVDEAVNCGVSKNIVKGRFFEDGVWPIHGERYLPTRATTGWYIWAGENDGSADVFTAVHSLHLDTWGADVVPYLGLPPGWRFLIAPGHEDVWFDEALLVE